MERDKVRLIVARELTNRGYATPSFVVSEDAEPDTVGRGGYPFHVTFVTGQHFTVLDSSTDTDQTVEAKIVRQLAILFPKRPPQQ